jgi:L-ascorbate metabolism protein UlaG (beta-lactamase superfamily)
MPPKMIGSAAAPLRITWLGHATFVLQTPAGVAVVIDPWLTTNPACPEASKQIDRADLILVTHGHADHIGDLIPVARSTGAGVVAIVELCHWLEIKGIRHLHPMNKGGTIRVHGVTVTMVRAEHSGGWAEDDPTWYLGDPVGYVLGFEDGLTVYVAGDTALFGDMRLIGELYSPDIAILPIGDRFTMGPSAAARACEWLGVRQVIPMHYGTFPQLTGTPAALRALVEPKGISVLELQPGETSS